MTHKKAVISFSIERLLGPAFSTTKGHKSESKPSSMEGEEEEEINIEESSEDENEDDENKGCFDNTDKGRTSIKAANRIVDTPQYTTKAARLKNPSTPFNIRDQLAGIIFIYFTLSRALA